MNARRTRVADAQLIELDKCQTMVGDLVVYQGNIPSPFKPRRVFYLYDIPAGESRGAHAHRACHQLLVAVSGSFEVDVTDGQIENRFILNMPHFGLHIPPGLWASELNFSGGAICLVLASESYDEGDYIRDFDEFKKWKTAEARAR